MTLDEVIERYTRNAEYERTHRNLQGCLEFRQLAEWLKELKQLREQPRWIPVSERLPDDRKKCLVTFKSGYIDIMCYALNLYKVDKYDFSTQKGKAGWYDYDSEWGYYSRDDVVAWMPLPEPYEESEDKE